VLVLSDNIDRATQKGFKVCFQTDYQEKLRGHFYIDIYIAAIVVLVSCLLLFSFLISFFKGFCPLPFRYAPVTVGSGRKADCAYTQGDALG
jgi:hypothetical protein